MGSHFTPQYAARGRSELIQLESVVRFGLQLLLPNLAAAGVPCKDGHSSTPRLPDLLVNVARLVEQKFFCAKVVEQNCNLLRFERSGYRTRLIGPREHAALCAWSAAAGGGEG